MSLPAGIGTFLFIDGYKREKVMVVRFKGEGGPPSKQTERARILWYSYLTGDGSQLGAQVKVVRQVVPGVAGPEHTRKAVEAARALLEATEHPDPGPPRIQVGAGVHTGTAYVGAVGSSDSVSDITVLGTPPIPRPGWPPRPAPAKSSSAKTPVAPPTWIWKTAIPHSQVEGTQRAGGSSCGPCLGLNFPFSPRKRMPEDAMATRRGVALVTGASSGLGRAIAERLSREGLAVAINYATSRRLAEGVVRTLQAQGGRAVAVQADVSDPRAVSAMFRHVERVLGPVQVLINNAGVTKFIPFSRLERVTFADWQRILGVNLIGAFLCAQAAAPRMRARGGGKIINISSNSALTAHGSSIPYVVSKGGMVSLTQCLARALAPAVQVNAVAPGWMSTPWIGKYLPRRMARRIRAEAQMIPVGDVAVAVTHLLSNDSITGQVLTIDQGEMWK